MVTAAASSLDTPVEIKTFAVTIGVETAKFSSLRRTVGWRTEFSGWQGAVGQVPLSVSFKVSPKVSANVLLSVSLNESRCDSRRSPFEAR